MRKVTAVLIAVCLAIPLGVQAQTPFGIQSPLGLPSPSSLSEKLTELAGEGIIFNPYVQVGYTHIGANISLPVQSENVLPVGELRIGKVDVRLQDMDLWTGLLGLNVKLGPKITVFGTAQGFAGRNMGLEGALPFNIGPIGAEPNFEMSISHLEFWELGFGGAYAVGSWAGIMAGCTWLHAGLEIADPRSGSTPLANQTLRANVLLQGTIPYVGLQIVQPKYNAAILYSPLVYVTATFSFRSNQSAPAQLQWNLRMPGQFVGFAAQYSLPLPPPMMANVWFTGEWINVKGNSDVEFTSPGIDRGRDITGSVNLYLIGAGLSVGLVF